MNHPVGCQQHRSSQTDLPAAWRALPAWLLHPQDKLVLTEQRRGDSGAADIGDSINLKRDFCGWILMSLYQSRSGDWYIEAGRPFFDGTTAAAGPGRCEWRTQADRAMEKWPVSNCVQARST